MNETAGQYAQRCIRELGLKYNDTERAIIWCYDNPPHREPKLTEQELQARIAELRLRRVEDKLAIVLNERDKFRNEANKYEAQRDHLAEAARAVIAQGRPHSAADRDDRLSGHTQCPCHQCTAWDALRDLLKTP